MNVKTLLTAKVTMIQSVSEGLNLVPLMATCSQNTLATDFCPHVAHWPKHPVAVQTDYQIRKSIQSKSYPEKYLWLDQFPDAVYLLAA